MKSTVSPPDISEFPLASRGKVRDVYDLGDRLLMVASDRLSAYDVVMPTLVPGKGIILNQMSEFWFEKLGVQNHFISSKIEEYPSELHVHAPYLQGRSMLVRKAKRFDVECVVRGYLSGSGWKDYQGSGQVCGIALPPGLRQSDRLDPPLFTPAAKNDIGHDENVDFATVIEMIGEDAAEKLRDLSLQIYQKAREYALERGILIADTKFEFGEVDGEIILIDEVLTPDSSRFWPASEYEPGREQRSFDKQYVRDYLSGLDWNKQPPGPELPDDVVHNTMTRYVEAFHLLTGRRPSAISSSS